MSGLKSNIFVNGLALFLYIGVTLLVIAAFVYWLPPRVTLYLIIAAPILTVLIIIYLARRV